ncbi:hypothetical protein Q8A67_022424 [Cirrhinus molitorella]|uniref:Uncharacterized protein n=1 Tax=Cirrhinus molitorella TaxID=172907 RepID=A0AA88P1U6_9TELE|nr:hypothetical protein Q8A67_022424 [Cirrhinus molitorella]
MRRKISENEWQTYLRSSLNCSLEGKETISGLPRPGLHSRGTTTEDPSREDVPVDTSYDAHLQAVCGDGDVAVSNCPVCQLSALVSWLVPWRKERDRCLRYLRALPKS